MYFKYTCVCAMISLVVFCTSTLAQQPEIQELIQDVQQPPINADEIRELEERLARELEKKPSAAYVLPEQFADEQKEIERIVQKTTSFDWDNSPIVPNLPIQKMDQDTMVENIINQMALFGSEAESILENIAEAAAQDREMSEVAKKVVHEIEMNSDGSNDFFPVEQIPQMEDYAPEEFQHQEYSINDESMIQLKAEEEVVPVSEPHIAQFVKPEITTNSDANLPVLYEEPQEQAAEEIDATDAQHDKGETPKTTPSQLSMPVRKSFLQRLDERQALYAEFCIAASFLLIVVLFIKFAIDRKARMNEKQGGRTAKYTLLGQQHSNMY